MYSITRAEAADKLWMSTRSVDRYVKAGKLRSKKDGKIIYIHAQDVENMSSDNSDSKAEVIMPQEKKQSYTQQSHSNSEAQNHTSQSSQNPQSHSTSIIDAQSRATLEKIYLDLRSEIKNKDQIILDISHKLGQAQEIAKNSVSVIEFKKSQYLLEESKWSLHQEIETLKVKESDLVNKLKYEKSTNIILIAFCLILMIGLGLLWFLKI